MTPASTCCVPTASTCTCASLGDERASAGLARSLHGEPVDLSALRATLLADLDAITTGLALLDR